MEKKTKNVDASKRYNERLPLQTMVTYRLDGQEYGNLAADVSPDGIFIRTFLPPKVGTQLTLTLRVPQEMGGFDVDLDGVVARVVEGDDPRQNGMGIHFTGFHAHDLEAVRYLVARIFRFDVLKRASAMDEEPTEPGPGNKRQS